MEIVSFKLMKAFLFFLKTEHVAKDLELFAAHGGRKTVNMKDVILCGEFPE